MRLPTKHLRVLLILTTASVLGCVDRACPKGTFEGDDNRCTQVPTDTTKSTQRAETAADAGRPRSEESVQPRDAGTDTAPANQEPREAAGSSGMMPADRCKNSGPEVCDNVDNDCDGKIDEALHKDCDVADATQCPGMSTCTAGAWSRCVLTGMPRKEVCDGVADDDCDGMPDAQDSDCECTNGSKQPCTETLDQCEHAASLCVDGKWASCVCEQASVFQASADGCATSLGVGANGNAWIAACGGTEAAGNNSILQLQGGAWSKITGAGIQLAVSPEGNAWVVNNKGKVYKWNRTQFELTPKQCATWVGVGLNDDAWIIGCGGTEADKNNSVYRLRDGAWVKQQGAGSQIAVSPEGNAWVLNNKGEVYRWNGTAFEATPQQCATSVGVGRDGAAWIVGCNANGSNGNAIYELKGDKWTLLPGNAAAIQIAVAPEGIPWVIDAKGKVLRTARPR